MIKKEDILKHRKEFFNNILSCMCEPPTKTDILLGQDKYYVRPDMEHTFMDIDSGDLAIVVKGNFNEKNFSVYYSIWQIGDILKIGIKIFEQDLHNCFVSDQTQEVINVWGKENHPIVNLSDSSYLYDWEFRVSKLYHSYLYQEKFIFGCRHMNMKVMKSIKSYCDDLALDKIIESEDIINTFQTIGLPNNNIHEFKPTIYSESLDDLNPFESD